VIFVYKEAEEIVKNRSGLVSSWNIHIVLLYHIAMNKQNKKSADLMEYLEKKIGAKKAAKDKKRKRNMKVSGASVRQLQKIIKNKGN